MKLGLDAAVRIELDHWLRALIAPRTPDGQPLPRAGSAGGSDPLAFESASRCTTLQQSRPAARRRPSDLGHSSWRGAANESQPHGLKGGALLAPSSGIRAVQIKRSHSCLNIHRSVGSSLGRAGTLVMDADPPFQQFPWPGKLIRSGLGFACTTGTFSRNARGASYLNQA